MIVRVLRAMVVCRRPIASQWLVAGVVRFGPKASSADIEASVRHARPADCSHRRVAAVALRPDPSAHTVDHPYLARHVRSDGAHASREDTLPTGDQTPTELDHRSVSTEGTTADDIAWPR
jgi:hypothetical protein